MTIGKLYESEGDLMVEDIGSVNEVLLAVYGFLDRIQADTAKAEIDRRVLLCKVRNQLLTAGLGDVLKQYNQEHEGSI